MKSTTARASIPEWAWFTLVALLLFGVWWRAHTFAPTLCEGFGSPKLWPVVQGQTEPLDCDEAAYAYMARRMMTGEVLYRDLAENKPPGGYWWYLMGARVGGVSEFTVRVMPVPIVLATVLCIWLIGIAVAGPITGCIAAFLYILLSNDPYLYGNGAQLSLLLNLFSVAALASMIKAGRDRSWAWPFLAGVCVGCASLVRQTAIVNLVLYVVALLVSRSPSGGTACDESAAQCRGWRAIVCLLAGFVGIVVAAMTILVFQGAGGAFFDLAIRGGAALAADTPAPGHAPPLWLRWLTGNADPDGRLPWPFGSTGYLVWWGSGSWPLWLASVPGLIWLARGPTKGSRRLIGAWTFLAWVQVIVPRQFWAHYYLLPTPGVALAVAVLLTDAALRCGASARSIRLPGALGWGMVAFALAGAICGTGYVQVKDYLLVRSELLTARYKGGGQWIRLRSIGREIGRRARALEDPKLFVWGWQSPLYFYSGLNCPSRHFFVNDLVRSFADRQHALVTRWMRELEADLRRNPPALIFAGYAPYSGLAEILRRDYRQSRLIPDVPAGLGLWVKRESSSAFDTPSRAQAARTEGNAFKPEFGIWEWLPVPRLRAAPRPTAAGGGGEQGPSPFSVIPQR